MLRMSKGTYMPAPSRARSMGPSSLSTFLAHTFKAYGCSTSAGKALILPLEAASASSLSLGRAVAATLTAAASRFAISPQMAPEAPVIHATFQGNLSTMHASDDRCQRATLALADAVAKRLDRRAGHSRRLGNRVKTLGHFESVPVSNPGGVPPRILETIHRIRYCRNRAGPSSLPGKESGGRCRA